MTREEAKKLLPIIQTYAEGKTVQYFSAGGRRWVDCNDPLFSKDVKYRIKPESKYRPFKTTEECWQEMLKHQPFGWIKDKYKYVHIVCVHQSSIECSPDTDDDDILHNCIMTFASVLEQGYTLADGTPFGIKEE